MKLLALSLAGLAALAVGLFLLRPDTPDHAPLQPAVGTAQTSTARDQTLELPKSREPQAATTKEPIASHLVRQADYLAEQWGARWPELREQLLESDWDPDLMVDPSLWPSWEETRPLVEAAIVNDGATLELEPDPDFKNLRKSVGSALLRPLNDKWGLEGDDYLNPERKPIKKATFQELRAIEAAHDRSIEPLIDAYLAAEQSYRIMQVQQGNYDHGLFTVPPPIKDPTYTGPVTIVGGMVNGWSFNANFETGRDPLLASLRAEIETLVEAKIDEIKAYIAAL